MKQQCRVCEKIFRYCHSCAINKDLFKNAGYCDEDCYRVSLALQSYSVGTTTAEKTIEILEQYNIQNKTLKPGLQALYNKVLGEVTVVTEEVVPQEDVEVVINENEDMTISENE